MALYTHSYYTRSTGAHGEAIFELKQWMKHYIIRY